MKANGYLVMERCEDYEQALALYRDKAYPAGGLLNWAGNDARAIFPDRASARAAIKRTEHYRLAFGRDDLPEAKYCVVVPVRNVTEPTT